jgi:hypothetical protein
VFLLLLCNDRAVLGPWVNSRRLNLFTGAVIAVLVLLSMILTASVVYPEISGATIVEILVGGSITTLAVLVAVSGLRRRGIAVEPGTERSQRECWRMLPVERLPPRRLTLLDRIWLTVLRAYLFFAAGLVLVRIAALATSGF